MRSLKLKHIAFAVYMAFLPVSTHAAGLGKLNVLSGLGEPLRADIELLSVTPEELDSITAAIASNEAYQNQGIDKPSSHQDIKIEVTKNTKGMPVLKLKSNQPMTDAFLDMLIQVDWSTGRLLREYTLLLDPPGYNPQPTTSASVQLPSSSSVDAQSNTASTPTVTSSQSAGGKSARKSKATEKVTEPKDNSTSANLGSEGYTTQRGDSLAKIASDMKPEGVSLDQMLVGLYEANPHAFDGNNMNRLKVGQIIRAPSAETLNVIEAKQAAKEVRVHSANWEAYKNKLAGIVADAPSAESDKAGQASAGKVVAAEDKAAPQSAGPKDVVKLSAADATQKANAKPDKALQDKLTALQEDATAKDHALKEAQERTADLEKQIEDMKKLMALKNDAMAKAQEEAAAAAEKAKVEPPPAEAVAPKPQAVEESSTVATEPVAKPVDPAPAAAPKVEESATKPKVVTPPPVEPVQEPSLVASMSENLDFNTLGIGGGALAVLGGIWFYLRNKRKKNLASFEEGIMTSGGLRANTVFGNTTGGTVDTGDTSFLTDFSQSTSGGMIDAHDVDPIAEAEVYMAYGRDAQAEEILKDAIVKEPKRYELHLKLLEIYQTNGNTSGFEAMSGELYTSLGAADPVWAKVAQLGIKMDPSNPLYQVDASSDVSAPIPEAAPINKEDFFASLENSAVFSMGNSDGRTIDSVVTSGETSVKPTVSTVKEAESDDLSLNLDALNFDTVSPAMETMSASSSVDDASTDAIDMSLDSSEDTLSLSSASPTIADEPPSELEASLEDNHTITLGDTITFEAKALDAPTLDFPAFEEKMDIPQLAAFEVSGESENNTVTEGENELSGLEFNLDDSLTEVDLATEAPENDTVSPEADASEAANFDFSDINLDLGDEDTITMTSTSFGNTLAGGEPEEVETKLDLVMAYLDMEDKIGAKELLEEVLKEGGENQRKRATELLAKIA